MHKRYIKDNLLLDRARKGDERAFAELFHHYYDIIFTYISKIVDNREDAEDLTMMTFEKAFLGLDKYAPTFGWGTWLAKVAKNTALDFLVAKKIRPLDYVEEIKDAHVPTMRAKTPEEEYIHKELGQNLDKILDRLPDNYKEVVKWRYYDDLNFKEITSKFGVSGNVARSYIFRARKQLRSTVL